MAVEREIWTGLIIEKPYLDGSFILASKDMSEFTDGKTINLADAGIEPDVLVGNNSYPISIAKREDAAVEIALQVFDTKNTMHSSLEKAEESENKSESIVRGHKSALARQSYKTAAYNWTADKNTDTTPVLTTTGEEVTEGEVTRKRMCYADILAMEAKFRGMELQGYDLNVCLSNEHLADLQLEDADRYSQVFKAGNIGIFKYFTSSLTPTFSATTGEKETFGATKTADSMACSFFWATDYVMRCEGEVEAFISENDPQYRADIIGYHKRFAAMPFGKFGIGAIYSTKVVAVVEDDTDDSDL